MRAESLPGLSKDILRRFREVLILAEAGARPVRGHKLRGLTGVPMMPPLLLNLTRRKVARVINIVTNFHQLILFQLLL